MIEKILHIYIFTYLHITIVHRLHSLRRYISAIVLSRAQKKKCLGMKHQFLHFLRFLDRACIVRHFLRFEQFSSILTVSGPFFFFNFFEAFFCVQYSYKRFIYRTTLHNRSFSNSNSNFVFRTMEITNVKESSCWIMALWNML